MSLADLKGTLEFFFRELFGPGRPCGSGRISSRSRSRAFEIDVKSAGLKGGEWLEVAGCGMVDPAVFEAVNSARGDDGV